jgi:hypothetical protein
LSKIQGWRRSKARSLPSRNLMVFMGVLSGKTSSSHFKY